MLLLLAAAIASATFSGRKNIPELIILSCRAVLMLLCCLCHCEVGRTWKNAFLFLTAQ